VLALPSALVPAQTLANPAEAAYGAIAAERARRKLPKLKRNATLEALAQQHATAALRAQTPKPELPGGKRLHDQVFDTLEEAKTVAVDLFITENPAQLTGSKNLASPKSTMVGVGVAKGDSAQYGNGRYWMVVIYAGAN
jgi:hypothetical protein